MGTAGMTTNDFMNMVCCAPDKLAHCYRWLMKNGMKKLYCMIPPMVHGSNGSYDSSMMGANYVFSSFGTGLPIMQKDDGPIKEVQ